VLAALLAEANMRANSVRSLYVSCWNRHHRAILNADLWPDHVPVPTFGPHARPNVFLLQCNTALPRWAKTGLPRCKERSMEVAPLRDATRSHATLTAIRCPHSGLEA
jgi:hypothetical protein